MNGIFDDNPHRLYRYTVGGESQRINVHRYPAGGSRKATPAAKCRCGWEGVGTDAILAHQALVDGWTSPQPPPAARNSDPDTSHAAAVRTLGRRAQTTLLLRTYHEAGPEGLTNEEAGLMSGLADDPTCCYWKRCSELAHMEYIVPTGDRRDSRAGRKQRVHAISKEGLMVIKRLNGDG